MSKKIGSQFSGPSLSEASNRDLSLESVLRDLPLYEFQAESNCLGMTIAQLFEKHPLLPGVILMENGELAGMVSRRRLLEYLIKPQGLQLVLEQPLAVLHSYARTPLLTLPEDTPILTATPQAFRRPPELQGEPIVVEFADSNYRLLDVQTLNIAYWQIRGIETQVRYERTQAQMIQSEKMASLGRLVDGVAHEILDPVGFIWGNLTYVTDYCQSLIELISAYETYTLVIPPEVEQLKIDLEFDFLQNDLPRTIASIKAGAERLTKLATSLQNFCHIDAVHPKPADLHANLDGILLLLKSRLTGDIDVIRNYGFLPPVSCYVGQLNQVFMNILTNAVNALINEAVGRSFAREFQGAVLEDSVQKPRIEITTKVYMPDPPLDVERANSRWVSIQIADNGPGMSLEKQQLIWESFSAEKRAEKETSLAVSYQIITAKHGGRLKMQSQLGVGTEFEILLPLE